MAVRRLPTATVHPETPVRAFKLDIRQYKIQSVLFYLFYGITTTAQLASIFIAYSPAARIWSISVNILIVVGPCLMYSAWRRGDRAAKTLLLSFVFMALLEQIRLASALGFLHFSWGEILVGPWALVMTTPLLLISVFQRNQDLHDKIIRIESEQSAKTAFLAQMSHELRTPLDTILGNAQLLARPTNQSYLDEGLVNIRQSGEHLLGMIDELLDHARAEAGKLVITPGPTHWSSFLESVHSNAAVLAAKNDNVFQLKTHGPQPDVIRADRGRLRQILDNLLANASRHTRSGLIRLDCLVTDLNKTDVTIEMSVTDTGEGIALKDQQRIFPPFERVDNSRRAGKGTGMGLAIARQLVNAMGGNITLQSERGIGSCFRFTLTFDLTNESPLFTIRANDDIVADYHGTRRRILAIDDNQRSRSILRDLFKSVGFLVEEAESGDAALAI
jgi:two-component system, sensor histidine kinase LadS